MRLKGKGKIENERVNVVSPMKPQSNQSRALTWTQLSYFSEDGKVAQNVTNKSKKIDVMSI